MPRAFGSFRRSHIIRPFIGVEGVRNLRALTKGQRDIVLEGERVRAFSGQPVSIDLGRVLSDMERGSPGRIRDAVQPLAQQMSDLVAGVSAPLGYYRQVRILRQESRHIVVSGEQRIGRPTFEANFAGCSHLVVFVYTVGVGLHRMNQQLLANHRLLDALLLERMAVYWIDRVSQKFQDSLADAVRRGCIDRVSGTTVYGRLSKDAQIGDVPFFERFSLMSMFNSASANGNLFPTCFMVPKFSKCWIFGTSFTPNTKGHINSMSLREVTRA